MRILNFRKFEKKTLRGFLEVELPSGMCIRDLTLHEKHDSRWIGYPSKPYTKEDGSQSWLNQIWFEDKQIHRKFQNQILSALDTYLREESHAA
jgi:hypothetical protein